MREDDGHKLDHQTRETLRLRAVEQVARGVPAAEVGAGLAALGLHCRTIYTWLAKERTEGRAALRAKPVPGRQRKLADEQLRELAALIAETDPRDHGFAVALWTREIVRQLIEARFGTALTVASVGRTLHDLGFSAQRPLYRAEQADPVAVARWKEIEYPKIAAEAKAASGVVFFVDEAGVRSDYHAGTTWAPVGATPTVRTTGARFGLNMISAISEGCAAVLGAGRHADRRGVHRLPPAAAARRRPAQQRAGVLHRRQPPGAPREGGGPFRRLTQGVLRLYRLPAYSPQLNPDEWVWKNIKHDGVAPAAPKGPEQMKTVITARLRRLQRLPHLVRSFFGDPELAYITAIT